MKKGIVYFLLTLVIVLSQPLTAVSAQSEPQSGTVDEDGDLVVEVLPGAGVVSGFGGFQLPESNLAAPEQVGVNAIPTSPGGLVVIDDKTPTLKFTKDIGATKYQIELRNSYSLQLLHTTKTSGVCDDTHCTYTLPVKLKPTDLSGNNGFYSWRVRSKTSAGWGGYSGYAYFYLVSKGFNSTFDSHAKKWQALYGDWTRVDPGYLKTGGVTGAYTSVIHQEYFRSGYVYEVTMKRKVSTNGDFPSNRIYFQANSHGDVEDGWNNGYEFGYTDSGTWFLAKRSNDAVTPMASGSSIHLKPYGWNKLTVYVIGTNLDLWINGKYLGFVNLSNFGTYYDSGWVGIAGYKNAGKSSLLVDKAVLYYANEKPYLTAAGADGVSDPVFELTVDPNLTWPQE